MGQGRARVRRIQPRIRQSRLLPRIRRLPIQRQLLIRKGRRPLRDRSGWQLLRTRQLPIRQERHHRRGRRPRTPRLIQSSVPRPVQRPRRMLHRGGIDLKSRRRATFVVALRRRRFPHRWRVKKATTRVAPTCHDKQFN
jgi:hypothetical protein